MKRWSSHWFLLLMLAGFYAAPVIAIDGTVNNMELGTVTCLNHMTGQASVGRATAGTYDCSGLGVLDGETIGIVLNGVAIGDPTPLDCTTPVAIEEQEPNDDSSRAQVLPNPCVRISGAASSGEDVDAYRVNLPTSQVVQIGITPGGTPFTIALFDSSNPNNIQVIGLCGDPGSEPSGCEGELVGVIDIVLFPCLLDDQGNPVGCTPGTYTLDITLGVPTSTLRAQNTPHGAYHLQGIQVWR